MEKEECKVNAKKMAVLGKVNQSILADCSWLRTSEETEIVLVVTEGSVEELAKFGICRLYISMQEFLKNLAERYLQYDYFL